MKEKSKGDQGKQESAADEPQREEKVEEGEEEQVGKNSGEVVKLFKE